MKEIKIMATNYKVKKVNQIDKYERVLGQINYSKQEILIENNLPLDLEKEVLIHEILHGILEKLGYIEINSNEQQVQSIASTLYLVLKENKLISF